MSLQSSEIKLAGAILLKVLTIKRYPLTPIGSRLTQKMSRELLKKSTFFHLGIVTDPKRSLYTKNHVHTTATKLRGLKGLKTKNTFNKYNSFAGFTLYPKIHNIQSIYDSIMTLNCLTPSKLVPSLIWQAYYKVVKNLFPLHVCWPNENVVQI